MSDFIKKHVLGALAVVDEYGRPYNVALHFSHVGDKLVWFSSPVARHSHYIAQRPAVSVVIISSDPKEAVYVETLARKLDDTERERLLHHHAGVMGVSPDTLDAWDAYAAPLGSKDERKSTKSSHYYVYTGE